MIFQACSSQSNTHKITEDSILPMNSANADVTYVKAVQSDNGSWTFYVTVSHPDTGWEDYLNGWDVVTEDGTILKPNPDSPFTRLLLHPHVDEQPFTRSQSGIEIPAGAKIVTVRANDLVDGFGGQEVIMDLTVSSGRNFKVQPLP
ncbi:MAG: hypothetical protein IIC79_06660 [Chloroflexi bacterium]|nr:hypothetical protein [Chloroflexota bacterium]